MHIVWVIIKWYFIVALCLAALEWSYERFFMWPNHKFGRPGLFTFVFMFCAWGFMPHWAFRCCLEYPSPRFQGLSAFRKYE